MYIYIYICVCVCARSNYKSLSPSTPILSFPLTSAYAPMCF